MKISLGVVEHPYSDSGKETGDVAEILESKYHVMEIFAEKKKDFIADALAESYVGAIENAFAGGPQDVSIFASAMENITDEFHEFIDREESGIHTKAKDAPLAGGRKKRQYRRVKAKTTFVDTGLYRNSFIAWVKDYG